MTFDSYYWRDARIPSEDLERAREKLAASGDAAAFALLLGADDPVANGVALDQFQYAEAWTRHGGSHPFARHRDEAIAVARRVLSALPSSASVGAEAGASHASALGALMNLATHDDASRIAAALARTRTANVRRAAALAAASALAGASEPDEALIAELAAVALDEREDAGVREHAISALGQAATATAAEALSRVVESGEIRLQASAAIQLLDRDPVRYRARIEALVRMWPEDAPYPASEVLELLEE